MKHPVRACAAVLALGSLTLLAAGCSSSRPGAAPASSDPRVVATYRGGSVTLPEFEDRYARSVGGRRAAADSTQAALRDFLQRFVDFKLKVREAERLGLDRRADVQTEIAGYRRDYARPYLLNQAVIEPATRLLYERQGQVVDASHVLITVGPDAAPADTAAAYARIQAVVDSVRAGMPFAQAAVKFSQDPSAQGQGPGAQGRLGYFSGGDMVDAFEDAAYATAVGGMSPVVRTQFGYHVLYVHDRRSTPQEIRVAHVMLQPEGPGAAAEAAARAKAAAIRDSALAGVDFARLASAHSADQGSAPRGGDLGWVPFQAPLVEPFKSTAFALAGVGDVSEVVQTQFGFHVIKLLERRERPSYDASRADLERLAARLPRTKALQDALAERVRREQGSRADTAYVVGRLATLPADSVATTLTATRFAAADLAHAVATVGDSTYTFGQLVGFYALRPTPYRGDPRAFASALLTAFLNERTIDVEAARLETRDAEFARTMGDFRDGIVLFKLMEDSVWTKAQTDSVGLRRLYAQNPAAYRFPDRTRLLTIESPSDSVLTRLSERLATGTTFADLLREQADRPIPDVVFDTVLVAGPMGSVYDRALALGPGDRVGPIPYRGSQRLLLVHDGTEPARPKTFDEARPELTTAYQAALEARLLARLRSSYAARLYPERLAPAFAADRAAPQAAGTGAGR